MEPKNDTELAKAIGTNRKCITRARARGDAPQGRDPKIWTKFLRDNCLGPYSAQRGYGPEGLSHRLPPPVESNPDGEEPAPGEGLEFDRKFAPPVPREIGETMIELAECLTKGAVTLEQYFRIGTLYIEKARNKRALKIWIELSLGRLSAMFPTPAAAAKEFPEMVRWLHAQRGPRHNR